MKKKRKLRVIEEEKAIRFCTVCGSRMTKTIHSNGFDEKTGEEKIMFHWQCPSGNLFNSHNDYWSFGDTEPLFSFKWE